MHSFCVRIKRKYFLKQNFNQEKEKINLISLKEIKNINELKEKSLNRSHREFSVSLKPFLVDHILTNERMYKN